MKKKITKAILPVAGMGTRFLPATKAQPKEMLPVFDTPAIQFIVEEAVAAGITEIIIVTGRGKQAIENHFDDNFELESVLENKGKSKELEMVRNISRLANFAYVRQSQPLGDGHAILQAKELIGPDESVVVLFGDDLVDNRNGKNAVQQLIETWEETQESVVLLEEVSSEDVDKYGIVDLDMESDIQGVINNFIEKPKPEDAPSNLGVIGKFILTPDILNRLDSAPACHDGEVRLANAFQEHLKDKGQLYGRVLEGTRFDTGDKMGFLKATLHYALKQEEESAKITLQNFLDQKYN